MGISYDKHICNDLASLKDEWIEIHGQNSTRSVFNSYEYVENWYKSFPKSGQARIYRINEGSRTIGFLPLVLSRKEPIRILSSLTNHHCLHSSSLIKEGYQKEFYRQVAHILRQDAGSWDILKYSFDYLFSEQTCPFEETSLKRSRISCHRVVKPTFTIRLDRTFQEYLERDLSSKTRHSIRSKTKRSMKSGKVSYLCFEGTEALEHFPEFLRLEDSGWKGTNGSSITKCGDLYNSYYRQFVQLLARVGKLRLYFTHFDEKPIAGAFGYFDGDTFHTFKIAYDEEYNYLSPGNLLLIHMIADLMDHQETRRLHLFPWEGGYKHRFINETTQYRNIVLFSPTFRGKGVQAAFAVREGLRTLCNAFGRKPYGHQEGNAPQRAWRIETAAETAPGSALVTEEQGLSEDQKPLDLPCST